MFTAGQSGHTNEHNRLARSFATPGGAVGDGVTNDSAALQAALTAATVGTTVLLDAGKTYRAQGLVIPEGVALGTLVPNVGYPASGSVFGARLLAPSGGGSQWMVDMTADHTSLMGVAVHGGSAVGGVKVGGDRCTLTHVATMSTTGPGVHVLDTSKECYLQRLLIINPCTATQVAQTGGLHIEGTDHWVYGVEAVGISGAGPRTANGNNAGIYVVGWNNNLVSCVGEFGDDGIVVAGSLNKFSACRADRNFGHGWRIESAGTRNSFSSCGANSNSVGADESYDGWHVIGGANGFAACHSVTTFGDVATQRFGWYDADPVDTNAYAAMIASGNATGFGGAGWP